MEIYNKEPHFYKLNSNGEINGNLLEKIIRIHDPNIILTCLSLFEDEFFNDIELIFIDNISRRNYTFLLNQKGNYEYLGFTSGGKRISHGVFNSNQSMGINLTMLSTRYLIIFKIFNKKLYDCFWFHGEKMIEILTSKQ